MIVSTKSKKNKRVYVRRNPDKKTVSKKRTPGWVWLLSGLLIGLGVAFLISFFKDSPEKESHEIKMTVPLVQQKEPVAPLPPKPEPRFDFYKSLRDMKIFIPDEEEIIPNKRAVSESAESKKVNAPGAYILQVASFKEHEMADALKAKLAILGIKAGIQTVTIEKGAAWHRVRIGPIHELPRLHETQLQLQQNNIEFILLKLKE